MNNNKSTIQIVVTIIIAVSAAITCAWTVYDFSMNGLALRSLDWYLLAHGQYTISA